MQKRIIIITAGLGNGHNSAACAIAQQKEKQGFVPQIIDVTKLCFMGKIMKFFFFSLSEKKLHSLFDQTNTPKPKKLDMFFYTYCFPELKRYIKTELQNADKGVVQEIIFTFPAFTLLLPPEISAKITLQLTDYISPHYSWIWGKFNAINVLDTESKFRFSKHIPSEKIDIVPFPLLEKKLHTTIPLKIQKNKKTNKKNIVLFFHNILLGNEEDQLQKIIKRFPNHNIQILAGRNYKYFCEIKEKVLLENNSNVLSILDWQKDMQEIYANANIVAGKCGGAFISEAMKENLSIIITGVFSGQEMGNYEYLKKYYSDNLIEI